MNTFYLGDCIEIMKTLPDSSVDLVLTDPPYGLTKTHWDTIIPLDEMWNELKRIRKHNCAIVLFGCEPFSSILRSSNLPEYKYDWYWEKERLVNIAQVKKRAGKTVETISIFYASQPTYNPQMVKYTGKKRSNKVKNGKLGKLVDQSNSKPVKEYNDTGYRYPTQVLRFKRDILTCNLHPTQKPLKLMEYLIKTYTNEGDTVLDFTMGSGTTGVACNNLNRDFIGIELDEKFFEIAEDRIIKSIA
jgi:site-specific DNA-methyltransferase (adenine-specific)